MAPVVVLVGAPGAGKSTIGRLVAAQLGVGFRDTDDDVEARAGQTIPDIFVTLGEPTFRELEHDCVVAALADHDGVLALGGGAVLRDDTRAALADQHVVWLKVDAHNAAGRVGMSGPRPLLMGSAHSALVKLLNERTPIYTEVADAIIDTNYRDPSEVAADVVASLSKETDR